VEETHWLFDNPVFRSVQRGSWQQDTAAHALELLLGYPWKGRKRNRKNFL